MLTPKIVIFLIMKMCAMQELDCSQIAVKEIPETNVIYAAVCIAPRDKNTGEAMYLGQQKFYHMVNGHVHHVLIVNHDACRVA